MGDATDEPLKPCSTCGENKPYSAFAEDRRRKSGRQARCRKCHAKYQKAYKQKNPERYRELRREYAKRHPGQAAAWVEAHREHVREMQRQRLAQRSPEQVEADRQANAARSAKYRGRNPEVCSARVRDWRARNPDRVNGYTIQRRRLLAEAKYETISRIEVAERDGWICQLCKVPIDPDCKFPRHLSLTLDHIIPVSRGGDHLLENVQAAHFICNIRKGARLPCESSD